MLKDNDASRSAFVLLPTIAQILQMQKVRPTAFSDVRCFDSNIRACRVHCNANTRLSLCCKKPQNICLALHFQRSNLANRLFPASTTQIVPFESETTPTGNPNASSSGPYCPKVANGVPEEENTITRYRSGSVI